uniref:Src like adaptor 2a n=1 Tax=Myripristis murdjan TaxID=586833 RepID=A0A667WZZ9_9TELE
MGNCPPRCRSNLATFENTENPPQPPMNMVVSLYDYPTYGLAELTMHIGERLTIVSDDGDFLMVKSENTGLESYIPTNYTAKVSHRWLFTGISRYKAVELLLLPHNQTGAFMVRQSQSNKGLRANSSYLDSVKHYRIYSLQNGWFYISPNLTFPSLHHLVEHYSESADGLCSVLREPCHIRGSGNTTEMTRPVPIAIRRPTLNWKDVTSSMIFKRNRTESEHSLVSEGLREAISSYLYMTEANGNKSDFSWDT